MRKLLLILLMIAVMAGEAVGSTYYVRPAATCANNGNGQAYGCAAAPGGAGAWNALASVVWDGAGEVSAGDTLYVAGTFTNEILTIGVSGSGVGTETIIRGDYAGDAGVVDRNGAGTYAISTNQKNYLKILNISANNATTANLYINGTSQNVIVDGFNSTGNGMAIYATSTTFNTTVTNSTSINQTCSTNAAMLFAGSVGLSVSNNTITGPSGAGIQVNGAASTTSSISLVNNEITGTVAGAGIYVRICTAGTITLTGNYTGITRGGVSGANGNNGIHLLSNTGTYLYADGNYSSYSTGAQGIYLQANTFLSGSYVKNSVFTYNGYYGIATLDTSNLLLSGNTADYNLSGGVSLDGSSTTGIIVEYNQMNHNTADGFNTHNGVTDTIVRYNEAAYNGDTGEVGSGDGFSSHDTDNVKYYYNIAHHNLNTGFAHGGTSTGQMWNNTIWANGDATAPDDRAGVYIISTAAVGWDIKNNIIGQNITRTGSCEVMENPGSNNTWGYNLFYPIDDSKFYGLDDAKTTYVTYTNAPAAIKANAIKADPLFNSGTYIPAYNSPAKNAGTLVTGVHDVAGVTDYAGNSVYNRNGIDIGCYEYMENVSIGSGPAVTIGAGPGLTIY